MGATISKRYAVYKLNNVLGSGQHKALEKVKFRNKLNSFETEDEAIQALIDDERIAFEPYIILLEVEIN